MAIDKSTGVISVEFSDKSKLNKGTIEKFDVPVTVTYKDGSTDAVNANFKLITSTLHTRMVLVSLVTR